MSEFTRARAVSPAREIDGSRALPAGFGHPHASEEARELAEGGMILRVQVGSGVHGTSVEGQDYRDEMGICLEPAEFVTGLARVPGGTGGTGAHIPFEQYERHTAWDKPRPSGRVPPIHMEMCDRVTERSSSARFSAATRTKRAANWACDQSVSLMTAASRVLRVRATVRPSVQK